MPRGGARRRHRRRLGRLRRRGDARRRRRPGHAVRAGADARRPRAPRRASTASRSTTASTCSSARTGRRSRCWPRVHRAADAARAVPSAAADAARRSARAGPARFELAAWNAPAPLHLAGGLLAARGLTLARAHRPHRRFPPPRARRISLRRRTRRWRSASPRRRAARSPASGSRCASPRSTRRRSARRPRCSRTCCAPRSPARVATATSSSRRSTCRRAFPMPRRGSSRSAAASCARGVAVRVIERDRRRRRARDRRGRGERSPPPSSPSGRISWRRRVGAAAAGERRVARAARAGRRVRLRIDHDDLPRIRRTRSPSACRCSGSTTRRASGRSTGSAALGGGAPTGTQSLIAVVISAGGPHDALDHATLARDGRGAAAPAAPRTCRRRTFSQRDRRTARDLRLHAGPRAPGGRTRRVAASTSPATTPIPIFPATLEAATRSGVAAARALIADGAAAAAARGSTRAP